MLQGAFQRFAAALRECANASARSMVVAGSVGAAIFTGYGILWLYVRPVEHESLMLRTVAVLLCLAVALGPRWPQRFKPLLPWAWYCAVLYALPFYSTYQLIGSNYSVLRSMLEVTMVFFVIVIFPHYALALTNIAIGIGLAVLAAYVTIPEFASLNHAIVKSVHIQAMVYSAGAGMLFMRSNLAGILGRQRVEALKDLAGSIAHELRNPLGQLRYRLDNIGRSLGRPGAPVTELPVEGRELDAVYEELAQCKLAVERGMQMIAMTLDEIHAKPLDASQLRYLSAERASRKAIEEFGYASSADRARVELRVTQDFVFKGDETRYVFVLFNLLKNAIYYFNDHPAARITISVDAHCVTFEDTGPGMAPEVLAHVFESFRTAGKPGGTGLGLSFCKRTMQAFGGTITCESQPRKFTRFILRFPAVPQREIAAHEAQILQRARASLAGKRVLVVDDLPGLRKTARAMLAALGAETEEAENGRQALERLAGTPFDAMLLDLSMPVLDGYATAERIRAGDVPGLARLPIVAYTAEPPAVARAKLERVDVNIVLNKPCSQVELAEALCRALDQARRGDHAEHAAASLAGRKVLLVDDEAFNRRYIRVLLEERRIEVVEAADGAAAFQMLQTVDVDAIVTDIHMPVLDGFGLAQAVRTSTLTHKPVLLALSAGDDHALLARARAAGIRDIISKPAKSSELMEKLASQLLSGAGSTPPRRPDPHSPAERPEEPLLNLEQLESLRRVGIAESELPAAIKATRAMLDALQDPIAQRDFEAAKSQLHSLVGTCANVGSHLLHQKMRAMYRQLVDHRQWPQAGWHQELVQLHARTAQAIRAHCLR